MSVTKNPDTSSDTPANPATKPDSKGGVSEGKTKRIEPTEEPEVVLATFKDDATAFNGKKHEIIAGKGNVNAAVSRILFERLEAAGIPTCFLSATDNPNQLRYKALKMIPLEVVVRNVAFGSLCKRFGLTQGQPLASPLLELFYKAGEDPLINDDTVLALGLLPNAQALRRIKQLALFANEVFVPYFQALGIVCADFKLEFGFDATGAIVLGDELSPDNFRLRDAKSGDVLDKDVFRLELGDVAETYTALLKRLQATTVAPAASSEVSNTYQAEVFVQSRKNIFSPESRAIQEGLHSMGHTGIEKLSAGKRFTFNITASSLQAAEKQVLDLTDALLANPVIEDYEVRVSLASSSSVFSSASSGGASL
ncbi:MAG: phosphoribosylformylglycinamidine synthase subunit PurS [Vampirovibrionales bacterium]|nr:phosphoribosylformylglycinamidine synthase subunit PurS [Vampirovibrionales bacterium]